MWGDGALALPGSRRGAGVFIPCAWPTSSPVRSAMGRGVYPTAASTSSVPPGA